jgi:hypothetical protein
MNFQNMSRNETLSVAEGDFLTATDALLEAIGAPGLTSPETEEPAKSTPVVRARRSHRKSRLGCFACKRRRIKVSSFLG